MFSSGGGNAFFDERRSLDGQKKERTIFKVFKWIWNYLIRMFTFFPYIQQPISFCNQSDFNSKGEFIQTQKESLNSQKTNLEEMVNYNDEMRVNLKLILHAKEKSKEREGEEIRKQAERLPLLDEERVRNFKTIFTILDTNLDGLIEFNDLEEGLTEFGDLTDPEIVMEFFKGVDEEGSGFIDFEKFLNLISVLIIEKENNNSLDAVQLANSLSRIEKNVGMLNNLTTFQQLQAGLF